MNNYHLILVLLVTSILHLSQGNIPTQVSVRFEKIKGSNFYGLDRFTGLFRADYCASMKAVCDQSSQSCQRCVCKDMMTFVSYRDGCKDKRDADVLLGGLSSNFYQSEFSLLFKYFLLEGNIC